MLNRAIVRGSSKDATFQSAKKLYETAKFEILLRELSQKCKACLQPDNWDQMKNRTQYPMLPRIVVML